MKGNLKAETVTVIKGVLMADGGLSIEEVEKKLKEMIEPPSKNRIPITVKRAAEILGCHKKTVERYAKRGILSRVKRSPSHVRYYLDEVEQLAREGGDDIKQEACPVSASTS